MDENRLTFVDLGRKGLTMHQLKDGFRFGTDTVLLSWFTASCIKEGKKVACLELGANCGAASLLLAGRRECVSIDALELDRDACEVLKANIISNGLEERVTAYEGDVRELPADIRQKQYDAVFMNPPFYREGAGPTAEVIGRSETDGTLEDFISEGSSRLIPSSGIMTVVMTARRADEVMSLMMKHGIKPMLMTAVHPAPDRNAQIVLIAGKKTASSTQLEIMPPLVLNDKEQMTLIYDKEQTDCFTL